MGTEAERIREEFARRRREIPADFYARWRPENLFARHGQERALLAGLRRTGLLPLKGRRILEVGCGDGDWLSIFLEFGVECSGLAGIDLDAERISEARARLKGADLRCGDATTLPWEEASFDIVVQSTTFSSILDGGMRVRVASEMLRVLKSDGVLVWYDFFFDNPANPSVRGVRRGELLRLFPGCEASVARVTLAPPLARRLVPHWWGLAALLESARIFDTHYLAVFRKEVGGPGR